MEPFEQIKLAAAKYLTFKAKFTEFHDKACKYCRQEETGIVFESQLEKDIFDVKFAGKYLRFSFSLYRQNNDAYGLVMVISMNPRTLDPLDLIGEFSLMNVAGTTEMILNNESKGKIDDISAPEVLYYFLWDSLVRRN